MRGSHATAQSTARDRGPAADELPHFGVGGSGSLLNGRHPPAGGAALAIRAPFGGADEYQKSPPRLGFQSEQHLQSIALTAVVPWALFCFVLLAVALVPQRTLAWLVFSVMLSVCIVFYFVYRHSKTRFYYHLAFWGLVAVVVAAVLGDRIFDRSTSLFWLSRNRVSHRDVDPATVSFAYTDSNALYFEAGTKIDLRRSFGRRTLETDGSRFCVAPIMNRELAESGQVHFWAAGRDCCETLSGFRCGNALRPGVRSGALLSPGMGAGSRFAKFEYEHFNLAAQQAAKIYHLATEERPVFVFWSETPDEFLTDRLDKSVAYVGALALLYLMFSFLMAGIVHLLLFPTYVYFESGL